MRVPQCNFDSIEDQFNFGRYRGLSLADVMDINPSYLDWCIKHCTGVVVALRDHAKEEIRTLYPSFVMDCLFESSRKWNLDRYDSFDEYGNYIENDDEDSDYKDNPTYERYSGTWAQDVEGYSDDDIDTIFDGDPSAYWNID